MNSSDGSVLQGLETEAREAKKDLRGDPVPVPLWVLRMARRWVPATTGRS
jgi:hypothetical protein